MTIGKPNHDAGSGNFKKLKRFYLKDGVSRYRILPPHGKLASRGLYFKFHRSHWGYQIKVNDKFVKIPFLCQREIDFRTKEVVQDCLICVEKVDPIYNLCKAKEAEFIQMGLSKDQIREAMKPFNEQRMRYNREGKYYYNVMSEAGEIGVLGIPTKAKKALDTQIKKCIQEYHFDPVDADGGCWFDFIKEGRGGQTFHSVEIVQTRETVTLQDGSVREVPSVKRCPLTPEIIGRMDDEAGDLTDLFPVLTDEDQRRLLDSGGDPDVYKAILDRARPMKSDTYSNSPPKTEDVLPTWDNAQATPPVNPKVAALKAAGFSDEQIRRFLEMDVSPTTPTAPVVEAAKPTTPAPVASQAMPEVDPEEAKLLAELAALKARKAQQAAPAPVAPSKAEPETDGPLSDEEWARMAYGQIGDEEADEISF